MGIIRIDEKKLRNIIRQRILEETEIGEKEQKPRCLTNNTIPLDEIVGKADDYIHYTPSVMKRGGGVNSMVDTIGILNNLRLFKDVNDGGSHLSYEMMNHLNKFNSLMLRALRL